MTIKKIATAALMASVALSPLSPISTPARADGKDFIAGAIIGGIIGSAVTKENSKKKSTKSTKAKTKVSSVSSEQREANKEVQTALNYFGYNVGTPDGAIGPKSRAAISEYQAFLGYPGTGELSEHERTILVTSYHRAIAGGPVIASTVGGSALGLKAVLIAQRDEMAGIAPATTVVAGSGLPAPGSVAAAAAAALPTLVPAEPEVAIVESVPDVVVAAAEEPALPSFMDPAGAKGSLASECNQISLTTSSNGGLTTAEGMQDANFALGEQFCLARAHAMANGDALVQKVAGFSADQIAEQCGAFAPVLKEHVAALSLKPAEEVLAGVEGFILSSGMSPAQLSGTAKVCLGVGYSQDKMDVAIGSALLLAAMGEKPYAEYLGHHLSQGFGATVRPDLAMDWYQISIDAMGQGQMVVAPEVAGRDALIKKAAYTINGRAAELEPEAVVQEAALPVFEVVEEPVVEEAAVAPEPVIEAAPVEEQVEVAVAPEAAPIFVAPELADVVAPEALGEPASQPDMAALPAADTALVNTGAEAAMMAARLPFLIFSSF